MIPTFTSQHDMMGFLRALPSNANYDKMLKEDFGVDVPSDAEQFLKEYLFKYCVEGKVVRKLTGQKLVDYAAEKTLKFGKDFPWKTVTTPEPKALDPNRVTADRQRVSNGKQADRTVLYLEHRNVYVGYWNGKIQCTKKTAEACTEYLNKKFA